MLTTKINPEIICWTAAKRHGLDISEAEAEIIHEKIIQSIGKTLDTEITRIKNDRQGCAIKN